MLTQVEFQAKYGFYPAKQRKGLSLDKTLKPQKEKVNGRMMYVYTPQEETQLLWALNYFIQDINGEKCLCEIKRKLK